MRRSRRLIVAVLVVAVVAGACSSSGSVDDELVSELSASVAASTSDDYFPYDADCVAETTVRELGGADAIEADVGVTAASIAAGDDLFEALQLDEAAATSLADELWLCADYKKATLSDMLGPGVQDADLTCFVDGIDDDTVRSVVAGRFMADDDTTLLVASAEAMFGESMTAMDNCGFP